MMWKYKCERCGCNLDPGEGRICDECRNEEKTNQRQQSSYRTYNRNEEKLMLIKNAL